MNILLSAYGCEPNRGSDAEVGWQWVINLARNNHNIWVLTRKTHQTNIEKELNDNRKEFYKNIHFIYLDTEWFIDSTNWFRGRIYLYYYLWQWKAFQYAQLLHKTISFDLVHHVTWVSVRQPSFMGKLGIPFLFGPVGGGEVAPFRLRRGYSRRQWMLDVLRDIVNFMVRIDPLMRLTFKNATWISVTSEDTARLVPLKYRNKVFTSLAIGYAQTSNQAVVHNYDINHNKSAIRVLYVGRFLDWKGMHIGLPAFKQLCQRLPEAKLTIIGRGPDEKHWRSCASRLQLNKNIEWVHWVDRDKLPGVYAAHDIFLFPSLHDSGGLVVLEAMLAGLPVVCLDLGGPGTIIDSMSGVKIITEGKSASSVSSGLAEAMYNLAIDVDYRKRLSEAAIKRAEQFSWEQLVSKIYKKIGIT